MNTRYEIRSIGLWSFIKQCFFLSLIVGFVIGLVYAVFLGMMINMSSQFDLLRSADEDFASISFGVLLLIVPFGMSLFACAFNTIIGILTIICYNGLAKLIGGLELELVAVSTELSAPATGPIYAASMGGSPLPPPPPPYGAAAPPPAPEPPRSEPPASKYE